MKDKNTYKVDGIIRGALHGDNPKRLPSRLIAKDSSLSKNPISVLVMHPNAMVRFGFEHLATQFAHIKLVGCCGNTSQAIDMIANERPDVVVLSVDVNMPEAISAVREALHEHPQLNVMAVIEKEESATVRKLVAAGVRGICSSRAHEGELLLGIESVAAGAVWFDHSMAESIFTAIRPGQTIDVPEPPKGPVVTTREREVLNLLAKGMTNQQIAEQLHLSVETVKSHIRRIMDKTNLRSRRELIAHARKSAAKP